ncbi:hypothetical protein CPSG_07256 [Coccidioides posadasii str. Silveira]|uniref:Uncharacterized protein n=1 Tax=Coccidioides posadasii (strain RMSCC 757 / Silveira) TaxID=443226 RepID=E9DBQ4_COCPS|nr:hypothetical protein CPSG_07256 [Coccidioides posadasii str. Silveira]
MQFSIFRVGAALDRYYGPARLYTSYTVVNAPMAYPNLKESRVLILLRGYFPGVKRIGILPPFRTICNARIDGGRTRHRLRNTKPPSNRISECHLTEFYNRKGRPLAPPLLGHFHLTCLPLTVEPKIFLMVSILGRCDSSRAVIFNTV